MPKVKLKKQSNYEFKYKRILNVKDINYGGHLGNDNLLSIIHEARVQFLQAHGYSEMDIEGCGIIMVDSLINYISESFYGDQLVVEVTVDNFSRSDCDFFYRLSNKKTGKEVARAKTGILFFDYKTRKRLEIPVGFREKILKSP